VGDFERKDPEAIKKADKFGELMKKVKEQLEKDGFQPKVAPSVPAYPPGFGGTIPQNIPVMPWNQPLAPAYPGYPSQPFYVGDMPGWQDATKIICGGPNSAVPPSMGGAVFSMHSFAQADGAGAAHLALVGAGPSGDYEIVDTPLNITPISDPAVTMSNTSNISFFKTSIQLRHTG
jgi:hypothetical protein